MKNILVINGSARKDSVSTALGKALLAVADGGFETKTYNAYALNAKPCFGCGWCDKNIGCINRDIDGFMADFEAADYLVITTPVYNGSVPSPLKAVVDRFQRYYALRFAHGVKPPIAKPKRAVLLIAAGSKGEGKENIENMFSQQFTVLNTALIDTVFVNSTDEKVIDEAEYKLAENAGKTLFVY